MEVAREHGFDCGLECGKEMVHPGEGVREMVYYYR